MDENIFYMVMEAGGNLAEPFDAGGADMGADMSAGAAPPGDASMGDPPPLDDGGMGDLPGFDDSGAGGDLGGDDASGGEDEEGTQNGGEKLSEKANSILNQKLYTQMVDRNQEIEDLIESFNQLIPLLSYETLKQNDQAITRLKNALEKGKGYVIEKFINAKYGENLIFFQKLDALYTLLLEQINNNLKKVKNSNEN